MSAAVQISPESTPDPEWEASSQAPDDARESLLLKIEGYEGPIDLLLQLARDQKVDLAKISILQLTRQYLDFIDRACALRLDLAAEYLVMASWLAYLKSRLLLPTATAQADEPDGETMAQALAFQLRRLQAMQSAAESLYARPRLGDRIFARGMPETLKITTQTQWDVGLYDILHAYGDIRQRAESSIYTPPSFTLMSMDEAMDRLVRMLGDLPRQGPHSVWTTLSNFLPRRTEDSLLHRSALASLLTASLEMTKQGRLEIRQDGPFRPVYVRALRPQAEKINTPDSLNRESGSDKGI